MKKTALTIITTLLLIAVLAVVGMKVLGLPNNTSSLIRINRVIILSKSAQAVEVTNISNEPLHMITVGMYSTGADHGRWAALARLKSVLAPHQTTSYIVRDMWSHFTNNGAEVEIELARNDGQMYLYRRTLSGTPPERVQSSDAGDYETEGSWQLHGSD